ncbi:RNA polymerase sigma factor [Nocardioides coralli]|uniref:RNA polymerase sigma factor n=1 Tax=Nocardioides coralli TaxID=2872154 RepID=UPI001CA4421A|nr:sigma-70 family RNA polymerase sigma factor [Nocardioides coralli]QZY27600.1 sigma-70 family RNA polymerase sigma factor [Nocardioides coralli]
MEPGRQLPRVSAVDSDEMAALARLYERVCPRLVSALTAIGGNRADAEEVAQEAFVTMVERWPQVSQYDDPEGWLRTVAVRRLVSRFRRREVARRGLQRLRAAPPTQSAGPVADGIDLDRALARLPISQRAAVVLHHGLDLPVSEVAALLDVPVGTVKSRLQRARLALADLLGDAGTTTRTT